jgi:hypothetical protein
MQIVEPFIQLPGQHLSHLRVFGISRQVGQGLNTDMDDEMERIGPQVVRISVDQCWGYGVHFDGWERGANKENYSDEVCGEVCDWVFWNLVVSYLLLLSQDFEFFAAFKYFEPVGAIKKPSIIHILRLKNTGIKGGCPTRLFKLKNHIFFSLVLLECWRYKHIHVYLQG